ncbi:DEAD/DEAH box helicase [Algimonas arctica]|uniref:DEAD-box ATP-dependent RNA helicase RhpA n=1 Tax=Algimonas arctica TaxID=1479486 RepID=A0A8J3CUJ9_9PROT|nr:DEAD/DEAH box helicase [Algimonas arctica]GHB03167.1 DEAD/DEAH box helicase [Algimonas arctica]
MSSKDSPTEISPDAPVDITFAELGLDAKILKALGEIGYEKPTPIQAQAIPSAMQNRDVLGIAQTGTGKTGAFVLPTMHKLAKGRARARMPRCLIICPTRELAAQVAEDVKTYGKYLKLETALLIGGVSFAEQDRKLTKGVDILIATPGRLLDQFERGKILMTGVQTLVVDEADRMLDMGFIPDIERIFQMTPFTRQVLFFSATMPPEIKRLVDQFLHQPVTVQIARRNSTAKTVRQRIARVPSSDGKLKRTALRKIIEGETVDSAIIFCNRKKDVDVVAKSFTKHGISAEPIHGDLAQSLRTKTLDRFKAGEIKFLVASDVAARGLDVSSVSHVFNYDVPFHSEDYIHRIGRTGRAGRKGDAIMLVAPLDDKNYSSILNLIGKDSIEEIEIPDVDNMPREGRGGNRGNSRSGSSKGRSSGSSSQSSSSRGNSSRRPAPKSEPVQSETPAVETKTETPAKPKREPRAKTTRTRKAPGRQSNTASNDTAPVHADLTATTSKNTTPESNTAASKTPSRRPARSRSKPQSDEKNQSEPKRQSSQREKSEVKKPFEPKSSTPKSSTNARGKSKSRGNSSKEAGFGGDMPAFFNR